MRIGNTLRQGNSRRLVLGKPSQRQLEFWSEESSTDGLTLYDRSGNNNHGSWVKSTCLKLNGTNNKLQNTTKLSYFDDTRNTWTIQFAVKLNNITTNQYIFSNRNGNIGFGIFCGSSGRWSVIMRNTLTTDDLIAYTQEQFTANQWSIITISYDGTKVASGLKFYFDDVLMTTSSSSNTLTADSVATSWTKSTFGAMQTNTATWLNFLNGNIGYIRACEGVHTPAEFATQPKNLIDIEFNSGHGSNVFSRIDENHLTLSGTVMTSTNWADTYNLSHSNLLNGFDKWVLTSDNSQILRVNYGQNGVPIRTTGSTITDYTWVSTHPRFTVGSNTAEARLYLPTAGVEIDFSNYANTSQLFARNLVTNYDRILFYSLRPISWGWADGIDVTYNILTNTYSTTYNVALKKNAVVDRTYQLGSTRAYTTLQQIHTHLVANPTNAIEIQVDDEQFYQPYINFNMATNINMICASGRAVFTNDKLSYLTPTWTSLGGGTYSTTSFTDPVIVPTRLFDASVLDSNGNHLLMLKQTSIVDCQNTLNSYYWDLATLTLYVHTRNNRAIDTDIKIYEYQFQLNFRGNGTNIYMENIETRGGNNSVYILSQNTNFAAKGCWFNYASLGNGLGYSSDGECFSQDCQANWNSFDGFNYHDYAVRSCAVEIDCIGSNNGWDNDLESHNGTTIHEDGRAICIGCTYENNLRNIHNVNTSIAIYFSCMANTSRGALNEFDSFNVCAGDGIDETTIYLFGGNFKGGAFADILVRENSYIYRKNLDLNGYNIYGNVDDTDYDIYPPEGYQLAKTQKYCKII
ncbi:MAG: hypothetical protein IPO21_14375 [Bacteroidales bacterium]|nr:hypothetical protein [Bacteroidales bacterium]